MPPRSEASTEGCPSAGASVPNGGPRPGRRTHGDAGQPWTLIHAGGMLEAVSNRVIGQATSSAGVNTTQDW